MTELQKQKAINRWEREKQRPRSNLYVVYIVFIISLIYMVDEIASQIGLLMKTETANDLFARFGESSVGALEILGAIGIPFQALGLLYRPLSDRWGRKIFLVINTVGMSIALLVIYLSQSIWLYFVGVCLIRFFIPHDIHVVYIMEETPTKHRAKIYSSIKFVATIGVMLVPLLRRLLMENVSEWRKVYFIPALIGFVASFLALLFARETDTFINAKLRHLRGEEQQEISVDKSQGGLVPALKFALKHKQLRWIYITTAIANLGFIGTINYQVIMSYAYAEGLYGGFTKEIMDAVSIGPVTTALMLFPVGCAFAQLIMGFISDKKGRKASAIVMAGLALVCLLGFYFGAKSGFNPYVVGLLCGAFIGSYYSLNDVMIMMVGESSPTNLRSSTMSAQFIVTALGVVVSYVVALPLVSILGNQVMGIVSLCLLIPGFVVSLFTLWKFTHETKGINLDTVTGLEWD